MGGFSFSSETMTVMGISTEAPDWSLLSVTPTINLIESVVYEKTKRFHQKINLVTLSNENANVSWVNGLHTSRSRGFVNVTSPVISFTIKVSVPRMKNRRLLVVPLLGLSSFVTGSAVVAPRNV